MIQGNNKKQLLPVRLSIKAFALLQAMADEQGISKGSVLEIMIRKQAEEVEELMPLVYAVMRGKGEEHND
jgi:hypothetical protein